MEGCRQIVEGEEVSTRSMSNFIDFKAPTGKPGEPGSQVVRGGSRSHAVPDCNGEANAENRRKPEQSLTLRR